MVEKEFREHSFLRTYAAELLDIIVNNTEQGIAVISTEGRFIYYNQVMGEIEGLQSHEMLGKHIFDIFPSFNMSNSTIFKCIRTGNGIYNNLQTYINFKGKKITSIVTDIPILVKGEVKGVVEVVQDIERLKKRYESVQSIVKNEVTLNSRLSKQKESAYYSFEDFITEDEATLVLIERSKKMASFGLNALIYGETGTGKEILAQSIHNFGRRASCPFIAQNCAAIPENLMESILFGTERGSFTGATNMPGLFEQADKGTLLLDELNSLPTALQAKLLRVLQEKRVKRVGGLTEKYIDVQVIVTMNEDPKKLIEEGRLREDLYYRLSTMSIRIPPLRERICDIVRLIEYYRERFSEKFGISPGEFSVQVREFLETYSWPGNVRELSNVMEYIFINSKDNQEILPENLPYYLQEQKRQEMSGASSSKSRYFDVIDDHERTLIKQALEKNNWNVAQTARDLNIKRQTLHNKIKKLRLERPR